MGIFPDSGAFGVSRKNDTFSATNLNLFAKAGDWSRIRIFGLSRRGAGRPAFNPAFRHGYLGRFAFIAAPFPLMKDTALLWSDRFRPGRVFSQ